MSARNVKRVKDLRQILAVLHQYLEKVDESTKEKDPSPQKVQVVDVIDFLQQTDLYSFDFQQLLTFFDKADLIKKLNGFTQFQAQQLLKEQTDQISEKNPPQSHLKDKNPLFSTRSILYTIKELLRCLTYNSKDGVFLVKKGAE